MLSVDPELLVDERRRRGKLLVAPLDGTALAARSFEQAQVRFWAPGAPLAEAAPPNYFTMPCNASWLGCVLQQAVGNRI